MQILKVFGSPGTGKTTRLMDIMEQELARGVKPDRLAFLTFTVAARKVALARAKEKFNLTDEDLPNFKTLHALAYRELGVARTGMIRGAWDLKDLGERLGIRFSFGQRHRDDDMLDIPMGGETGDRLLLADHLRRHRLQSVEEFWQTRFDDDLNIFQVRHFTREYHDWKQSEGLRDFTDLLEEIQDPIDVDVMIVDEAQDLSKLQWQALHVFCRRVERLYIGGDDDQAIFHWAGADYASFIDHPGQVTVLERSWRVPRAVQPYALRVIERVSHRQPKVWQPHDVQGSVKFRLEPVLHELPAEGSVMFLYRHHYLADPLEQQLREHGLPYVRSDRSAPGSEWGKSIVQFERLRKGKQLTVWEAKSAVEGLSKRWMSEASKTQLNKADRNQLYNATAMMSAFGLSHSALERPWYEALDLILPKDLAYLRLMVSRHGAAGLTERPRIQLSTIHASKGAECDHTLLLTDMSKNTRESLELNPDVERRTFYVGMTRAKQSLTIIGAGNPLFREF